MPSLVRLATARDAGALHRIAALTFPLACTPHTPAAEKDAYIGEHLAESAFSQHLDDPARTILVAVDDASPELIGYSMLTRGEPDDVAVAATLRHHRTIELSRMYVHPDHHGDGTAGRLMAATLAAARESGAAGAWLGVSDENVRANAFYAKHGFEQVGRKQFRIGNRVEDDFVRERQL
ncbi:MAG: family N-acetyltransferase [Nocardioides sp.]|jgi:ribosomal protein S18 acetylase RimI-like enzyme|uniref:GNAT family N-acetyltransferase n=1 Tax=Nocardioides sp. TaxID=35761 RepID=UPI0026272AC9|nr:GNAT family N-acetyltransferase [Nocardioides sp.]MCW2834364.1 family N-acetyltransferase [Nocardioides sp.]